MFHVVLTEMFGSKDVYRQGHAEFYRDEVSDTAAAYHVDYYY